MNISGIDTRVKTAMIALPILFFFLYFQLTYTYLMLIVIYITHNEYYIISTKIMKIFMDDYYTNITYSTLISFALTKYIFMLCPIILYILPNSEIPSIIVPMSIITIVRLINFISIHRVVNTPSYETIKENGKQEIKFEKVGNPIEKEINKLTKKWGAESDKQNQEEKHTSNFNEYFNIYNQLKSNPNFISQKMFCSCMLIILFDYFYFIVYALPLCIAISIHNYNHGFYYLVLCVIISYQCDNGALLGGNKFGKIQFGGPITPSKTYEGIYGGIVMSLVSANIYRLILINFANVKIMGLFMFNLYAMIAIFAAIIGDFFESFIKRCADVKDSGNLIPGHGGLLDRVDSLTLVVPIK